MEKTSVEWFAERIQSDKIFNFENVLKQAKEMEKQQIIDAWENGYEHGACVNEDKNKYHGIQYYNETFKQQEQ
jgi:predicted transcriptional regulator